MYVLTPEVSVVGKIFHNLLFPQFYEKVPLQYLLQPKHETERTYYFTTV